MFSKPYNSNVNSRLYSFYFGYFKLRQMRHIFLSFYSLAKSIFLFCNRFYQIFTIKFSIKNWICRHKVFVCFLYLYTRKHGYNYNDKVFLCLCRLKKYWFLPTNKDLLILETNIGRPLKMENMRYNIVCPKKYTIPFFATLQTLII